MKRRRTRLTLLVLALLFPSAGCAELPQQAQGFPAEFIRQVIAAFLF